MIINKQNIKSAIEKNIKLKYDLRFLQNQQHELEHRLVQINISKAYKLLRFLKKIQKNIAYKFYKLTPHSTNILKTEFKYKPKKTPINELVSIVIPTRNGGNDFKKNLTSIMNQKNIPKMEILILDNNSTDGTCEYAIKQGCRVYPIKENEFGHGKTRAFGVNEALGKYIILTVQDASINDEFAYSNLINFMKENDLSAASGCQKPKPEADSFAMWQNQYHYGVMNPQNESIIYDATTIDPTEYQKSDFLNKRKIICIDDVIACYRRDVFEKFNFSLNINFAEDAYLAQLILLDKKKIGLTHSSIVFHSHNVNPIYAFKRAYVDTVSLKQIFNQNLNRFSKKPSQLKSQLSTVLILASTLCSLQSPPNSISSMIEQSKELETNPLTKTLRSLFPKKDFSKTNLDEDLINSLSRNATPLINDYSNYCKKIGKEIFFEKLMANILGNYLAEIILSYEDDELRDKIESSLEQRV